MARSFAEKLSHMAFSSSLYQLTLMGPLPKGLTIIPTDPWPGDAGRGAKILAGRLDTPAGTIEMADLDWSDNTLSPTAENYLNGFSWLRDLHALGGAPARHQARKLINSWIEHCGRWQADTWQAAVVGERLTAWLNHYGFFGASADEEFHSRTLDSVLRQLRHLSRIVRSGASGADRFRALKGLIYASACLEGQEERLTLARSILKREVAHQILSDGLHIERSPQLHMEVMKDLIDIRAMLAQTPDGAPESLHDTIARMGQALRCLLHADGKLAQFNSSFQGSAAHIAMVLDKANAGRGQVPVSLTHSGFEKVMAGTTGLIMDVGNPSIIGNHAHAGTLSFEMTLDYSRAIVNCGAYFGTDPSWRKAIRATAAHSTAVVADKSSLGFADDGSLTRKPRTVAAKREEVDGSILLEASHDGYARLFGLTHTRRLYISTDGRDIRGEDRFAAEKAPRHPRPVTIRFHLHPTVEPTLLQNRKGALLRLTNGKIWKLRTDGGLLEIEDSIYLPQETETIKTKQLVIHSDMSQDQHLVKWAFRQEGK